MNPVQKLALLSHLTPIIEYRHLQAVANTGGNWEETIEKSGLGEFRDLLQQNTALPIFRKWCDWIDRERVSVSSYGDAFYPESWLGLSTAPLVFHFVGSPSWLTQPLVAVVGSRHPMQESLRWMEWHLSQFLNASRAVVVSGGARGIDMKAHVLAVQSHLPTVAAMPVGLMSRYPKSFHDIEADIIKCGGAVLSAFPPDWPLHKVNFLKRNQLIAALAKFTVVVEARRRSGSMLTARAAQLLDRPVGAVPSSPLRASGLGTLDLLAENALLLRDHLDLTAAWGRSQVHIPAQLELI